MPVKQFALRTGLPLHQPPRLKEWAVPRTKDGHAFDIGVVVSFGHFIPPSVLDALPWGAINMHPSLLPRHTYPPPSPNPSIPQPTNQPASQPMIDWLTGLTGRAACGWVSRHRGAAPIYHTLLQDDSVTGVTVLEIHRQRFDAGRIFSQTTLVPIHIPLYPPHPPCMCVYISFSLSLSPPPIYIYTA